MSEGAPPFSATASYDAPPATYDAPPAAPMAPAAGRGGGAPKSNSVSQWDPRTGSHPMSEGVFVPPTSATSYDTPPVAYDAPLAATMAGSVASGGPPKSYSMPQWDPHTGSHPMSEGPLAPPASGAPPVAYEATPALPMAPVTASGGPPKSYSMSRWDPHTGSHPMSEGPLTPPASAASYDAPPVTTMVAAAADVASGGAPKSYSVSRWDPRTGSHPMSEAAIAPPASVAYDAPPAAYDAPPAVTMSAAVASGGPPKSFSVSRWDPCTRSHPMSEGTSSVASFSPQAANAAAVPPPPLVQPVSPAGPSMADLAKDWASMNQDQGSPSSLQSSPVASNPASSSFVSSGSGPKKSYSVSKWSPQSGSSTGGKDAPGGWTPSASSPRAAAPQKDTMADLAVQWAAMNN